MNIRKGVSQALGRLPVPMRLPLSRVISGDCGPLRWWRVCADRLHGRSGRGSVMLVGEIDQVRRATSTAEYITQVLRAAGIATCALPSPDGVGARLAVQAQDLPSVGAALAALPQARAWSLAVERKGIGRRTSAHRARRVIGAKTIALTVAPRYAVTGGGSLRLDGVTSIDIEVWDRLHGGEERADGEPHLDGTRVPRARAQVVPYLIAEHWDALCADSVPAVPALQLPGVFEVVEPIDVVYTWVDGDDPAWQERKSGVGSSPGENVNRTADAASRFASRDELRYSLRSLELFAPWVRHIYIVTDDQRPAWLDGSHPRISVVDHREIFADATVLPVFNSHAIESQLHHIPGLSDRYLYMNDDVMFGRPVSPALFFEANGLTRFFLSRALLDVAPATSRDLPVLSAAKNNAEILAASYGKSITQKFQHTPHPQSRAVLTQMEATMPELFAQVAASKIRHPDDVSIASALQHYVAYATGTAVPGRLRYAYVNIAEPDAELRLAALGRNRDKDVFCLNDTYARPDEHERASRFLADFFQRYFPLRSSFELPGH